MKMSVPTFFETVSVCLSRVLEAIGVNEGTVTKRRKLYHEAEVIREMGFHLTSKICEKPFLQGFQIYHFGSKIEGSTTLGLKSDVDLVHCNPTLFNIVESVTQTADCFMNLMMVKDKTTPHGHARLCFVDIIGKSSNDIELCNDDLPYHYDFVGRKFLHNTFFTNMLGDRFTDNLVPNLQHGPSLYYFNTDNVSAFHVPPALSMTTENIHRFHSYNWPTTQLIDKLRATKGFLVPVGHTQSENAFIEWRISKSFAERMLVFDFNITQLRCLVVLKMIKKSFFQPVIGDESLESFTSYHCKTTLFHTIARTRPSLWREDRLLECLMCCISTLRHFLLSNYCPHFFDLNVNLFYGKLTPWCCKKLICVVTNLQNNNLRCLLQVKSDSLGERIMCMQEILRMDSFPSRDLVEKQMLVEIVYDINRFLIEYSRLPYVNMHDQTLKKQIYAGFMLLKEVLYLMKFGRATERTAARLLLPHFISKHASLISAYRLKKKQPISEDITDMFKIGFQADATSNRLKLASVLYCNGELSEVVKILKEVEEKYASSVLPICFQLIFTFAFHWEKFFKTAPGTLEVDRCRDAFSACVEYMKKDIWCCPIGLRRSLLVNEKSRQDIISFNCKFGIEVDSRTMLYYLEYLTYDRLSLQMKTKALKNLMQCVLGNPDKWLQYFFDIANREEKYVIEAYRDRVFAYPEDKYIKSYHEVVTPELCKTMAKHPWGNIRLCLCYAFHKCSIVQHMNMALLLTGYCFETEKKTEFASAFYWMSFLVEPSRATADHVMRVCPKTSISQYFINYYSGMARMSYTKKLEIGLIPEIVEAFTNVLEASMYLGSLQKANLQLGINRSRFYVCIVNALIRKYDKDENKY